MLDRFRYVLVASLAGAALFAGCGGDDDEEDSTSSEETTEEEAPEDEETEEADGEFADYQESVQAILLPLGQDLQTIGAETQQQTSPDGVADGLGDAEETLDEGISELEGIEPPADVEEPHENLITAFQAFDDATTSAREEIEGGNPQEAVGAYGQAAVDFEEDVLAVREEFEEAGLDLGAPVGE